MQLRQCSFWCHLRYDWFGQAIFYTKRDIEHTVGYFAAGIGEILSPGEKCMIAFSFTGPFCLGDLIAKAVEQLGEIPHVELEKNVRRRVSDSACFAIGRCLP